MKEVKITDLPECLRYAASLTSHPIVEDEEAVYRYKPNGVIVWLFNQGLIEMNKIWSAHVNGAFSIEDLMQFYRELGYSLGGFEEIFSEQLDEMEKKE